jgi:hypothetical protein
MELFLNEKHTCVLKREVHLCARGDQQVEGESFKSSDLYAPTFKAPEARLLAAIAAEYCCPLLKTVTQHAFRYGEMGEDEKVYIHPHYCWNQYLMVMFFYFSKACMAQNRPPHNGIFASRNGWSRTVTQLQTAKRLF